MAEKPEKQKIVFQTINFEEVKNSALISSSTPSSPMTLRKASSVKYNCLCSPTTHAGSFRCRYHKKQSLTRNSVSLGSKLSEFAAGSKLSELAGKPGRMCDLHAQ